MSAQEREPQAKRDWLREFTEHIKFKYLRSLENYYHQ